MLKNDTLKNGTSRIVLYGSAPPHGTGIFKEKISDLRVSLGQMVTGQIDTCVQIRVSTVSIHLSYFFL